MTRMRLRKLLVPQWILANTGSRSHSMSLVRSLRPPQWCHSPGSPTLARPGWGALITTPRWSTRMCSSAGRWASSAQQTSSSNPNKWIPDPITTAHNGQDFSKAAAAAGTWPSMRGWFAEVAGGGMVVLGNHPISVGRPRQRKVKSHRSHEICSLPAQG
jgi:hypothetical protein